MKQGIAVVAAPPLTPEGFEDMQQIWGTETQLQVFSVLATKSPEAISPYVADANDKVLLLGLENGTSTTISIDKLTKPVEAILANLQGQADFALFACAGDFAKLASPLLTVQPNILLRNMVKTLLQPHMRLAVITPSEKQIPHVFASWLPYLEEAGVPKEHLVVDWAPPSPALVTACARRLAAQNVNLVVVECLAYKEELRKCITAEVKAPVILVRTVVANVVKEFTSSV